MAGVNITKYFAPLFSAINPKNGLNRDGIRRAISKNALIKRLNPNFSISNGSKGAKNDEKVSCDRCAKDMVNTLSFWNFLLCNLVLF